MRYLKFFIIEHLLFVPCTCKCLLRVHYAVRIQRYKEERDTILFLKELTLCRREERNLNQELPCYKCYLLEVFTKGYGNTEEGQLFPLRMKLLKKILDLGLDK